MTLFIISVATWAALEVSAWIVNHRPHRPRRAPKDAPPVVTVYDCKRWERERKERLKKAQAQRDIETAQVTINDLDLLMDAARERYHNAAGAKETEKALRQIVTLRKQIAATEAKIEKAKYIIKYE